jgi:hypothetical protein
VKLPEKDFDIVMPKVKALIDKQVNWNSSVSTDVDENLSTVLDERRATMGMDKTFKPK